MKRIHGLHRGHISGAGDPLRSTSTGGGVSAGGESAGLLVCQNFEGTGYDNSESWTESVGTGGTVNEDYTGTVLRGTQSLLLAETDYHTSNTTVSYTASGSVYIHAMFRFDVAPSDYTDFLLILDGSDNILCRLVINEERTVTLYHGTDSAAFVTLTADTTYHIWVDYIKGTGSNGVANFYYATNTTQPAAALQVTAGTATVDAAKLRLQILQGSPSNFIWDQVYVKTTAIGNVPA